MLTYQLQPRVLMKQDQKAFVFPSEIEIEILFEPSAQFGNPVEKGKQLNSAVRLRLFMMQIQEEHWRTLNQLLN
jgi:hypothetical protein